MVDTKGLENRGLSGLDDGSSLVSECFSHFSY